MSRINRRAFLAAMMALAGGSQLYRAVFDQPDIDKVKGIDGLLQQFALAVSGIDPGNPEADRLDTLEARLLARDWTGVTELSDFHAWVERTIKGEFALQKTVRLDGWIVSEFERDMILYAFLLQRKEGVSVRDEAGGFESARLTNFIEVKNWGPRSSCVGMSFNPQSDGHSSHWFTTGPHDGRLIVHLGNIPIPTTRGLNVITTKVEGSTLQDIIGTAGSLAVTIYDPARNIKQAVGVFEVLAQPPRALMADGKKSICFGKILDWGPRVISLRQVADAQETPIWIKTSCTPSSASIMAGRHELRTVVGHDLVTGTFDPANTDMEKGLLEVVLVDAKSGESVPVGALEIRD